MKVAIVYDRVSKWGGAERVLLALHELFPEAPLYTSVYNPSLALWAKAFPKIHTSFLQKWPRAVDRHEYFAYLMPLAFESFDFDGYDLVISVTSEAAKGIITKPSVKHVCYCLTPTRYLWSGYDFYFRNSFLRFISRPIVSYLKNWDKIASSRPDRLVAISGEVRERIKRFYKKEAEVIYPPIEEKFLNSRAAKKENFYLVVSRLVPYKKVDLAIEAFNELGHPLVIVGAGSEEKKLKRMSSANIKFVGGLTDNELLDYYKRAKALVFCQDEDFGLVAVEANASGTPVIAYKKGGVEETIKDGKTGVFFDRQDKKSLIDAVKRFDGMKFNQGVLKDNAKRFSKERFKESFRQLVNNL